MPWGRSSGPRHQPGGHRGGPPAKPDAHVRTLDGRRQLDLQCEHPSVRSLDDEVHLAVTVLGPDVADPQVQHRADRAHAQGGQGLEECPSRVPSPTRTTAPVPCSKKSGVAPTSRAARAGSTKWCLGAWARRRSGLSVGCQAGTASSSHRRCNSSRYAVAVCRAGCRSLPRSLCPEWRCRRSWSRLRRHTQ